GKTLVIGSRESALAVIQTKIVMTYLEENHPEIRLRLETMKTTGDRILDRRLDEIGGKGLFVKELDQALREERIDLSVHSMKDMPVEMPEDLPVIGYSRREDPRDVLVLPAGIKQEELSDDNALREYLNAGRPIGTSSGRRVLQLQEIFPNVRFESVRGNVATRLRKLDEGQYGALILASAGLKRLGLENRISRYFEVDEVIPSAGQGILALQGRRGEDYSCLDGFCDTESAFATAAERAYVRALGGGCTSPIAAHTAFAWEEAGAVMTLRGFYYDEVKQKAFRKQAQNFVRSVEDCARAGKDLAEEILAEAHG
ncbi:MAG: hydroxymethylbilane synthase, partial [Eubacteriales bacterium]|nr:hydroxymethylbilane synthase [Eubacteriales bacterium]